MRQNQVTYLAEYKARLVEAASRIGRPVGEPALPGADRLWELLDRNISLSVWMKER